MADMIKKNIEFSPPDISESEINEVAEALRSGWITTGPRVKKFERLVAEYVGSGVTEDGVSRCVCLNSQTACGELSLRLLEIGPGDEVIVPAYTYTATASVVCHVGAKLVIVDSQSDSPEMDYDALEDAITERTKAIIPVDVGGVPCDYDRIFDIVEHKRSLFRPSDNKIQKALGRIAVVADTAHSLGARVRSTDGAWGMCGAVADFSNFSFHAVKNLTTAEGGALTWCHIDGVDDGEIYRQLQLFSLHGQSKDALAKTRLGAWEYDILGPWYKCNMTDVAAAIGLSQLERYPGMLARRREIIGMYNDIIVPAGVRVLPHYTGCHESSGHLYITVVPGITPEERGEIISRMAEAGVACNVHYKPLPLLTAYKNLGFDIADYPNARAIFEHEITLPLHTRLSDDDASYVAETYKKIVGEYLS